MTKRTPALSEGADAQGQENEVDESRRNLLGFGAASAGALLLSACLPEEIDVGETSEPLLQGADGKANYQEIRDHTPVPSGSNTDHVVLFARGAQAAGDGGEGFFYWSANETAPDNGLTVLLPTGRVTPGRWKREGTGMVYSAGPPAYSRHSSIINVRWFGAKGDGATPDHVAIQAALNEVQLRGGTLLFPPGRYVIQQTLDAGAAWGVRYQGGSGSGRTTNIAAENALPQSPATLVWQGAAGGTLFKWGGADCIFDGLAFQGRFSGDSSRAGVGFQLYRVTGVATGKGWFPSIHVNDCDVGFQCGLAQGDANCDTLSFGRFAASDCTSGFKVLNDQGMNFVFLDARFQDIGNSGTPGACFDFVCGGILNAEHMFGLRTPLLLSVQGAGNSNSGYRIGFIKLDAQQDSRVVWVKHTGTDWAHITIDGGAARTAANQSGSGVAAFQIQGLAVLRVRNVSGGMAGATSQPLFQLTSTNANRTTTAVFENCGLDDLDPDVSPLGTLTGPAYPKRWQLRDCYRGQSNHFRVPDIGNLRAHRTGASTIAAGSSSVLVNHNIFGAGGTSGDGVLPRIFVTSQTSQLVWVTNVTATTFTANRTGTSGSVPFYWRAEIVQ